MHCKSNTRSTLLATGAFGTAYLGIDIGLSKQVVIKEITFDRCDPAAIEEIRTMFQQEMTVRSVLYCLSSWIPRFSQNTRFQALTSTLPSQHCCLVRLLSES
jgi:hypothetical protein